MDDDRYNLNMVVQTCLSATFCHMPPVVNRHHVADKSCDILIFSRYLNVCLLLDLERSLFWVQACLQRQLFFICADIWSCMGLMTWSAMLISFYDCYSGFLRCRLSVLSCLVLRAYFCFPIRMMVLMLLMQGLPLCAVRRNCPVGQPGEVASTYLVIHWHQEFQARVCPIIRIYSV